jgi:hypothetical protein
MKTSQEQSPYLKSSTKAKKRMNDTRAVALLTPIGVVIREIRMRRKQRAGNTNEHVTRAVALSKK